jgi:hypothetical protein
MARSYADENFSYRVIERLRALGHDVLTVQEAGERAATMPGCWLTLPRRRGPS